MVPTKGFMVCGIVPRGPTTCGGGLEREIGIGEQEFGHIHDEIEKGSHLRPLRYLATLLGMIAAATEL